MTYKFTAEATFEADDVDQALSKVVEHLLYLQCGASSGYAPLEHGGPGFMLESQLRVE